MTGGLWTIVETVSAVMSKKHCNLSNVWMANIFQNVRYLRGVSRQNSHRLYSLTLGRRTRGRPVTTLATRERYFLQGVRQGHSVKQDVSYSRNYGTTQKPWHAKPCHLSLSNLSVGKFSRVPNKPFVHNSNSVTESCQPRRFFQTSSSCSWYGHLSVSPEQVSKILHRHEFSVNVEKDDLPVHSFVSNQVASNNPLEDRRGAAKCTLTNAMLFGVFDGHHGPACAQVISERLFNYIAAEVLPYDTLQHANRMFSTGDLTELVDFYEHPNDYISHDRQQLFKNSLAQYLKDNISIDYQGEDDLTNILMIAFDRLDKDLSTEALKTTNGDFNDEGLHRVFSGACACIAYVKGDDLYVANAGDCQAVLGRQKEDNVWSATSMSFEHNAQNSDEVRRIRSSHPLNESSTVIKNGRLLSELAPLRAFGDVRYKWSRTIQHQVLNPWFGTNVIPKNYHTPPYLIATPDVIHHQLMPSDKFLILASDGLWDCMTPEKAVNLVGDFLLMSDKVGSFQPSSEGMSLQHLHQTLARRKAALWPVDTNVATHLIRYALGGVHNRFDHNRLANTLSLPDNVVRQYRDDITVTVVFFN